MKKLRRLFTAAILLAAATISMTSCLGSNDDTSLSPEQEEQLRTLINGAYYGDMSGNYQNKVYFYNDTITNEKNKTKTDSITDITGQYYKGDSILVIDGFPGRLLAKEIKDNDALKKAVEDAPNQRIKAKFVFFNFSSPYAYYNVYPYDVEYSELTYNGETHKVRFTFYGTYNGVFYNGSKAINNFEFYLHEIYVDDKLAYTVWDGYQQTTDQASKKTKAAYSVLLFR